MIDYITAKFQCSHDCASIPRLSGRYARTRLERGATTIDVKSVDNGRSLVISGNPVKYLQHHNVFGSNDLQGLCRDLLAITLEQLRINFKHEDQLAVDAGRYSLSRVDLAVDFRLPSADMVSKAIRQIEWHWRELGRNVSNYGDDTVYHNQHSKVAATKFYNKAKEIRARPLPARLLGREACERLRRYAEKILRAEFTLRSPALKAEKLNIGSEWTIARARALIQEKIASQSIQCKISHLAVPEGYAEWGPELKQVYRLWLQDNDLRALFMERTLMRRSRSLMAFGIDIRRPPARKRIVMVPIEELLIPDNIAGIPRFAKRLGLIHLPRKKSG